MEDIKIKNNNSDTMTVIIIFLVIFLFGYLFYYSSIRPQSIKQKCANKARTETRERFTDDDIIGNNKTLENWFLQIRYKSCLVQNGISNPF